MLPKGQKKKLEFLNFFNETLTLTFQELFLTDYKQL